jgi:hypothetical protein
MMLFRACLQSCLLDNHIAKFFKKKSASNSPFDDDITAILVIANAINQSHVTHRVQGAGYHWLGHAKDRGKASDRVGWRDEIDMQQNRHLAQAEITRFGFYLFERDPVPKAQRFGSGKFDRQISLQSSRYGSSFVFFLIAQISAKSKTKPPPMFLRQASIDGGLFHPFIGRFNVPSGLASYEAESVPVLSGLRKHNIFNSLS